MTIVARLEERSNYLVNLTRSTVTKNRGLANGLWGVIDYVAQPTLMLLATPLLLHRVGPSQYGLWILASALVSGGGLVSSGFGDAAIKYISDFQGKADQHSVVSIIRGMLTINLVLGSCVALTLWSGIPYAVHHLIKVEPPLWQICIISLRIGSIILIIKSIESIFVSTLRAFESYRPAVRIAIVTRISTLFGIVLVVAAGGHVIGMMLVTTLVSITGLVAQVLAVRSLLGRIVWLPSLHLGTLSTITGFGCYSWLQSLASISFGQADRLIIGALLGVPALGYYSICTQVAQPIHGLLASGLQPLFPFLSARWQTASFGSLKNAITIAFSINFMFAFLLSTPLLLEGKHLLVAWLGVDFAQHALPSLFVVTCSFALLGMNVTAYYTLLAAGKIRQVAYLNLVAGGAMLFAMSVLIPRYGILGAAVSRLIYGPITWLMYVSVYKMFWRAPAEGSTSMKMPLIEEIGA